MKRFYVLLLCLLTIGMAGAQTKVLHGIVLDEKTREPLIGASVVLEGTTTGTVTDLNGRYEITVKPGSKLHVSYIGYKTQDVTAKNDLQIMLQEETSVLDEVMVVAFGTTTKRSYTGSASVVKSDDLVRRQSSNITNSLAGQMAGVQGLSTSGQPGEVSDIRIRGIGSLNSSNAPLYVIDGVPATNEAVAALSNNDIESVTVQKDAASNALYGARGANGVILITTKRGSSEKAHITFDAKWGTNRRGVPNYDVMTDAGMYYETFYKAMYNGAKYGMGYTNAEATQYAQENLLNVDEGGLGYQVYSVPAGQTLIGANGKLNPNATPGYVNQYGYMLQADDWYKELFQNNNLRQEYNLNISGSDKNFNYFASASYLDDKGIIENSGYKRITARTNLEYQARKWLKLTTNLNYAHSQQTYPSEDEYGNYSSDNLFYVADNIAPIYPLYVRDAWGNIMKDKNGYTVYDYGYGDENGEYRPFMAMSNPASAIDLDKDKHTNDLFNGKWMVVVEPYKGLKLNANVGVDYAGMRDQHLTNPYYGQYASSGGYASVSSSRSLTVNQQYLVTYDNKFGGKHQVNLLGGYENYSYTYNYLYGTAQKLYQADVAEVGNAILSPSTNSYTDRYRTQSILFQAKYAYDNRYFLSASYNRNASSRFAEGHQWGNFWSVGAAWDIKGEAWMSSLDWMDQLKLRASYGAQGNDNLLTQSGAVNYYPCIDQYELSEYNGELSTSFSYKGNKDLTWETSYNLTIGTDFSFLQDRLSGTVEFWRRRTKDQLYYKPVASSLGYNYLPVNIGSVANTGLDLELRGDVFRTKHVTWNLYANLTYYRNKILKLSSDLNGEWIEGSRIYKEGESMYQFYIPSYAGVDQTDGKALWYMDVTDDQGNVIGQTTTREYSEATKYATGDILPKVYGGFGTRLEAYGVDLDIAFSYQAGGRIMDAGYQNLMHSGDYYDAGTNWHKDILNAWTPENRDTDVPALNSIEEYENATSDRFLISSNYLSLQNITIGYTLPKQWMQKLHIDRLRVYAVADNVALWSKRKGLDPRQSYTSVNGTSYAAMRTISGGFTIEF